MAEGIVKRHSKGCPARAGKRCKFRPLRGNRTHSLVRADQAIRLGSDIRYQFVSLDGSDPETSLNRVRMCRNRNRPGPTHLFLDAGVRISA